MYAHIHCDVIYWKECRQHLERYVIDITRVFNTRGWVWEDLSYKRHLSEETLLCLELC